MADKPPNLDMISSTGVSINATLRNVRKLSTWKTYGVDDFVRGMRKPIPEQLFQLRKRAGLSLDELARRMDYKRASSIQRYESVTDFRGKYLSLAVAERFAKALGGLGDPPIAEEDIMRLAGPRFVGVVERRVPIISFVQAGNWTAITDPYPPGADVPTLVADTKVGPNAYALEIEGRSMETRFQESDRIIIDPDVEAMPGDFVVASLDNQDKATFKQYRPRGFDQNQQPIIELRPLNDLWPTIMIDANNRGTIIGTMVEHHSYRNAKPR